MSEPTQCRRYGCTCDGHPALDGYCSCECRDVQEARDECGSLIGLLERERALHNQCDGVKQSQAAEIERLRALLTRVIAHDDHIERDDDYYTMTHDLRCDIDAALASTDKPTEDSHE